MLKQKKKKIFLEYYKSYNKFDIISMPKANVEGHSHQTGCVNHFDVLFAHARIKESPDE